MKHVKLISTAALASVLLILGGIAAAESTGSPLFGCPDGERTNARILTQAYGDPADLQWCQKQCATDYGIEPYFRGDSSARWWMYTSCIQDCNRRFWKDYDRKMRDLEEETE